MSPTKRTSPRTQAKPKPSATEEQTDMPRRRRTGQALLPDKNGPASATEGPWPLSSKTEEDVYGMAYSEVQGKERREGLWAKCLSDTDGDQKRAEALYLRYRVRQIVQELQLRELEEAKIKSIRDERLLFNCPKCRNEISISRGELSDYGTTKHPAFRFTCPFCFRGFDVRCVVPQPAKSKAAGFPVATPCPTTSPRLVKKGLAVSSLVCGILGAWFSTLSIPAVICGHMSLSRIKKKPELYGGKRMAIAGLILGYIGLALAIAVGAVNGLTTVMLREMGLLQK